MVNNEQEGSGHYLKQETKDYVGNHLITIRGKNRLEETLDKLKDKGLATSVYKMGNDAFEGLAKFLAEYNLWTKIFDLFEIGEAQQGKRSDLHELYAKFNIGNDAFITLDYKNLSKAKEIIEESGLEAKTAGHIQLAEGKRTGVTLIKVEKTTGYPIYFSGRD